jgi:hypothetical protein
MHWMQAQRSNWTVSRVQSEGIRYWRLHDAQRRKDFAWWGIPLLPHAKCFARDISWNWNFPFAFAKNRWDPKCHANVRFALLTGLFQVKGQKVSLKSTLHPLAPTVFRRRDAFQVKDADLQWRD